MKDKNNKQVRDGDIIKYTVDEYHFTYRVHRQYNSLGDNFDICLERIDGTLRAPIEGYSFEIIGNAYDNPELWSWKWYT